MQAVQRKQAQLLLGGAHTHNPSARAGTTACGAHECGGPHTPLSRTDEKSVNSGRVSTAVLRDRKEEGDSARECRGVKRGAEEEVEGAWREPQRKVRHAAGGVPRKLRGSGEVLYVSAEGRVSAMEAKAGEAASGHGGEHGGLVTLGSGDGVTPRDIGVTPKDKVERSSSYKAGVNKTGMVPCMLKTSGRRVKNVEDGVGQEKVEGVGLDGKGCSCIERDVSLKTWLQGGGQADGADYPFFCADASGVTDQRGRGRGGESEAWKNDKQVDAVEEEDGEDIEEREVLDGQISESQIESSKVANSHSKYDQRGQVDLQHDRIGIQRYRWRRCGRHWLPY